MKLCPDGHITRNKRCWCGKKAIQGFAGAGCVNMAKHERPRDEHGLNHLDELRRATRGRHGRACSAPLEAPTLGGFGGMLL